MTRKRTAVASPISVSLGPAGSATSPVVVAAMHPHPGGVEFCGPQNRGSAGALTLAASFAEWLQADGAGGFASGTAAGPRTRRYHALLLTATPTGRVVLVNGLDAWVDTPHGTVALSTQHYAPDATHPDGMTRLQVFTPKPWPAWTYALPGGGTVTHEVVVPPDTGQTVLRWRLCGAGPCRLHVRLLLSGRDYHSLHHENPAFRFEAEQRDGCVAWRPYPDLPPVAAWGCGYRHDPVWYRQFLYTAERERGLDCIEDLASPGVLSWDLGVGGAELVLRADDGPPQAWDEAAQTRRCAASAYLTGRGAGLTVMAGYPWFTDWGRDTFIALRGLLLATGQQAEAAAVLDEWAGHVSEGMLPNRFPDGGTPEYNSVDASLWFVVAVHDLLSGGPVAPDVAARLRAACLAILQGYSAGTRYGIGADTDDLLRAGVPGQQLTWMDAKVGDWVVTPRRGKPVEVQALWINALAIGAAWDGRWAALEARARASFLTRFPNGAGGLFDVVDVDGAPGATDARVRPNQVFAVGGLPHAILPPDLARSVVDVVEARLLTPLGLRTLDPADPEYRGRYTGGVLERDGAYHQGTAWPWLLGPFVEAWLRVRGSTPDAKAEARSRFLPPLHAHLHVAGLGHVSEVVDGDAPHAPGGCPFQAWSLGELLRIEAMLDAP